MTSNTDIVGALTVFYSVIVLVKLWDKYLIKSRVVLGMHSDVK